MSQRSPWPILLCSLVLSCNALRNGSGDGGGGGRDGSVPCTGLACQVVNCAAQGKSDTTLTGVVNIPAGNLPLYNASVYVPGTALPTLVDGPACDVCGSVLPGSPISITTTDVTGKFTLRDVPAGKNIPLVVSLGKWRREVVIPEVAACTETSLDPTTTRLPKNSGEGHIPKIALTTGGYDAIECLLRKLGIDDSEFTPETGAGRVNLFAGNGGTDSYQNPLNQGANFTVAYDAPNSSNGWWSQTGSFNKYDVLVLSCEGAPYVNQKSAAARAAMQTFIDQGGRVFASHWHNAWIASGPAPLNTVAQFIAPANSGSFESAEETVDQSFDKGQALATWLLNVGGSTQLGQLLILNARNTVQSIDTSLTQRYIYFADPQSKMNDNQYFSFNAPVGAKAGQECGRMVFTDIHVSGNDADNPTPGLDLSAPNLPFPSGCVSTQLSAQEKALIFLLFDLSNCVQPILG